MKRRRRGELDDLPALPESSPRRKRAVTSYAEATNTLRVGDCLVDTLGSAADGLKFDELAHAVQDRLDTHSNGKQYQHIRAPLIKHLLSGRARRRIVVMPSASAQGSTETVLQHLLLKTLQIESDVDAPWSLPPLTLEPISTQDHTVPASATAMDSSLHMHAYRAEELVGRRVEIWWAGDAQFHAALVVAYHRSYGPFDGLDGGALLRLRHTVEYEADGLRMLEDLDGGGEPALWRLCSDGGGVSAEEERAAVAHAKEVAEAEAEAEAAEAFAREAEAEARAAEAAARAALAEVESATAPMAASTAAGSVPAQEEAATEKEAAGEEAEESEENVVEDEALERSEQAAEAEAEDEKAKADEEAAAEAEEQGSGGSSVAAYVGRHGLPRVEQIFSLNMLRNLMPPCQHDVTSFHTPPGWAEEIEPGARTGRVRWVQRDTTGSLLRSFERRVELEDELEAEYSFRGSAWLGQYIGGVWEIRPRALAKALQHVLEGLVSAGAVSTLPPERTGKAYDVYCAANVYCAGEAFPRTENKREADLADAKNDSDDDSQLAEIERERLRNIEANQEILRQLGLA